MKNILYLSLFLLAFLPPERVLPAATRPLEYVAMVNQYSVADPTADWIYINTLGATLTYDRTGTGLYTITADPCVLEGEHTVAKAWSQWIDPGTSDPPLIGIAPMNLCQIWYQTYKEVDGVQVLHDWSGIFIEIKIYP